jgi:hypothetical protein
MEETAGITNLWPPPDSIVTVGLNLDPFFKKEYRQRYFACLLESPSNKVPVLQYEPIFALPKPFRGLVSTARYPDNFVGGPFRWLLRRLLRFRRVLLWPASYGYWSVSRRFDWVGASRELPRLEKWLRDAARAPVMIGAIVLNLSQAKDCAVLWEVADSISDGWVDHWYVSDLACKEVYKMHHHDKVMASVPGRSRRNKMLRELASWGDVFEDCSGYHSEIDDNPE